MMEKPGVSSPSGADGTVPRDERGFSLIEVIVASVIAVIAVVGLAHSFAMGRALVDQHESGRDALGIAQQRLEILANLAPSSPDLTIGNHNGGSIAINDVMTGTEQWNVVWVDDPADGTAGGDVSGPDDYKRVTVTVAWSQAGLNQRVQLSRIFLTQ
jgi:prepilin-type N-terminal cleavage/methylation domain-containing protein